MRPTTIRQIDDAGQDVRAWCFACARGTRFDGTIWMVLEARGLPLELGAAERHFRCNGCRSSMAVRIFPARRPPAPPTTAADVIAGYFHAMRAASKKRR